MRRGRHRVLDVLAMVCELREQHLEIAAPIPRTRCRFLEARGFAARGVKARSTSRRTPPYLGMETLADRIGILRSSPADRAARLASRSLLLVSCSSLAMTAP